MIIIKKLLILGALGASALGVNAQKAKAATVNQNVNANSVKRTVNNDNGVSVFTNYENARYTGELLRTGDEVNVYDTKTDLAGNKWIKIGQGEWIMEQYTVQSGSTQSTSQSNSTQYRSGSTSQSNSTQYGSSSTSQSNSTQYGSGSTSQSNSTQYGSGSTSQSNSTQYGSGSTSQSNSTQYRSSSTSQSNSTQYRSSSTSQSRSTVVSQSPRRSAQSANAWLPPNENSAKEWIAQRESGGSYTAQNGQYYGRYQLSRSYLNGNYSSANQEKVANNYVKNRYGSWSNAKSFWQTHGWY